MCIGAHQWYTSMYQYSITYESNIIQVCCAIKTLQQEDITLQVKGNSAMAFN